MKIVPEFIEEIFFMRTRRSVLLSVCTFFCLFSVLDNVLADQSPIQLQAVQMAQKYVLIDTHIDVPYRLEDAAAQGWQHVRHSDLPVMRALSSLQASVVPEPGSAFLLAFSSLIFLRRRRANPFGGEHSQHMQDCSLPAGGGVNQETP